MNLVFLIKKYFIPSADNTKIKKKDCFYILTSSFLAKMHTLLLYYMWVSYKADLN